jgi:hypothetical protein
MKKQKLNLFNHLAPSLRGVNRRTARILTRRLRPRLQPPFPEPRLEINSPPGTGFNAAVQDPIAEALAKIRLCPGLRTAPAPE